MPSINCVSKGEFPAGRDDELARCIADRVDSQDFAEPYPNQYLY